MAYGRVLPRARWVGGGNALLLESGAPLLWEDGSAILLEEPAAAANPILLESGVPLLWENGDAILLEDPLPLTGGTTVRGYLYGRVTPRR